MYLADKYPGYTYMALDVNDIKSVQKSIEELRVAISEGPIKLPDGDEMFFIRDQDRNVIEFHQNG